MTQPSAPAASRRFLPRWMALLGACLLSACQTAEPMAGEAEEPGSLELVLVEKGPQEGPPPIWFAVVLAPGESYDRQRGTFEQDGIALHVQFLQEAFQRGELIMAGPYLDDSGVLALWQALGLDEARALAGADPLVQQGVFEVASIQPWMVVLR